jgi:uncharacterized protein (TIGR02466 family)
MLNTFVLSETLLEFGIIKNVDNKVLTKLCLKHENTIASPEGLDETHTRSEDRNIPMHDEIKKIINQVTKEFKKKYNVELSLLDFWCQIHRKGESTNLHHHVDPENIKDSPQISAVYYVKIPKKAGKIVFRFNLDQYVERRQAFNPKESMIILFPSSLLHYVTRNQDTEKRIAISFNFKIIK